jgi:hypothetical protein
MAATVVKPQYSIDVDGNVVEFAHKNEKLYVATDTGKLEIYNWKTKEKLSEIKFDIIHDFMGDPMPPKVFGVDVDEKGDRLLLMVQDEGGERILYLYEDNNLTRLLDKKAHIQMREVRSVDDNHLLIATIGGGVNRYNANASSWLATWSTNNWLASNVIRGFPISRR